MVRDADLVPFLSTFLAPSFVFVLGRVTSVPSFSSVLVVQPRISKRFVTLTFVEKVEQGCLAGRAGKEGETESGIREIPEVVMYFSTSVLNVLQLITFLIS